jgi:hypothetical protein
LPNISSNATKSLISKARAMSQPWGMMVSNGGSRSTAFRLMGSENEEKGKETAGVFLRL